MVTVMKESGKRQSSSSQSNLRESTPEDGGSGALTAFGALSDPAWLKAFARHLWRQFREDRSWEAAGALSYTSLLALVPLMAVIFGVVSAFPVFDRWAGDIESYIFENFVPAAGDQIQTYLQEFVQRTAGLTGAGTIFLIVTAILLMATIEKSFNRIWRVPSTRRLSSRLVTYWAVLTLGPILMGASLGLTSYLAALPLLAPEAVRGAVEAMLLNATPFAVSMIGFALVFLIVPNRRVRLHHALVGALISAVLFEVAKRGFVFYVSNFPTYERLYGALATIPLFLVWIYVSWVVVLLGASLSAALTTFNYQHRGLGWSERHELLLALRLLGHLWHAQRRGAALSVRQLREREPAAGEAQTRRILGCFLAAHIVHPDNDGDWLLSADLDELTLAELYRSGPFILPVGELNELPVDSHWDRAFLKRLGPVDRQAQGMLNQSVKSLLNYQMENEE